MGGWEVLVILLVPVAVWILSSVFKGEEERPGARSGAPEGGIRSGQRRPVTDLDRFLEEARRRRESGERRPQPVAEAPRPQPRPLPPRPVPPAPVAAERRPARPPVPRRRTPEAPPPRPQRPPVVLEAVSEPPMTLAATPLTRLLKAEAPNLDTASLPAAIPVASPATSAPEAPRTTGTRPTYSSALVQLAQLLRTPQSAGTAIVLREVFDRPRCRRPR